MYNNWMVFLSLLQDSWNLQHNNTLHGIQSDQDGKIIVSALQLEI